ncbi:hypothetical protein BDU57DRAFT_548696 [Ampelomyces quisqualis]|uniref:Uncharacterized protein n=1 Tax=Ampelomyces quisqualis TaxID=50730 RepID=A0A6A5QMY2_AMPQU|nr:hypothetical protein BDU57DRAFT_548696 [Ampelomyces quisqualis]
MSPYGYANYSSSLPSNEFRTLRRAQDHERLNTHFEHRGNRHDKTTPPYSAFRAKGLSQDERVRVSETRKATRAALGASFDFDDDSYKRSRRRDDDYARPRGWKEDAPCSEAIPQRYIDDFNKRWHEDDEENDADRYLADHTPEARWRKHEPIRYPVGYPIGYPVIVLSEYPRRSASRPRTSAAHVRVDSGYGGESWRLRSPPPQLISSKFSFDDCEKPSRRRGFRERLHLR